MFYVSLTQLSAIFAFIKRHFQFQMLVEIVMVNEFVNARRLKSFEIPLGGSSQVYIFKRFIFAELRTCADRRELSLMG
jgi:hypothetical protein